MGDARLTNEMLVRKDLEGPNRQHAGQGEDELLREHAVPAANDNDIANRPAASDKAGLRKVTWA